MIANSHHTGILEVSRWTRSIRLGRTVGWLIAVFVVISLLAGLVWSQNSVRYPGAEPQATAPFQIRFLPIGSFSQQNAYQTPDDLPQVLGWYSQHFKLGHEMPQGDNCVTLTQVNAGGLLQPSLAVTLCTEPTRTLIFINRSMSLR